MRILYHANCNDGLGAALVAWHQYGDLEPDGTPIEYIPVQYGEDPPEGQMDGSFPTLILDFSYPRAVLVEMARKGPVLVIDHHKTAMEDLKDIPSNGSRLSAIFDMEKSGAVLTWEFFRDSPVPWLLRHIQDRDLWRFEFEDTKTITAGLRLYPDFRDWLPFLQHDALLEELKVEGRAVTRFIDLEAEKIVQTPPREWPYEDDIVPFYNLQGFMISDTLHKALDKYPDAPYAVSYFDLPNKRVFSLRSRKGSPYDVSLIAKSHGGGGHKNAAGFTKPGGFQ